MQIFSSMTLILPILNIQRHLDRHTNETDQRTDRQSGKNPPPPQEVDSNSHLFLQYCLVSAFELRLPTFTSSPISI